LYSLSKKYGVTVDEIRIQNQAALAEGLKIGQSLTITKK
jgi:LysM repeat protein